MNDDNKNQDLTEKEEELLAEEDSSFNELHNFLSDLENSSDKLSQDIEDGLKLQSDELDTLDKEILKIEDSME